MALVSVEIGETSSSGTNHLNTMTDGMNSRAKLSLVPSYKNVEVVSAFGCNKTYKHVLQPNWKLYDQTIQKTKMCLWFSENSAHLNGSSHFHIHTHQTQPIIPPRCTWVKFLAATPTKLCSFLSGTEKSLSRPWKWNSDEQKKIFWHQRVIINWQMARQKLYCYLYSPFMVVSVQYDDMLASSNMGDN